MTKRQLLNIERKQDDGYEYHYITSYGSVDLYGKNRTDEEYENLHMDHLISDYTEDGYEVISASCERKGSSLIMNFLARRKK